MTYLPPDSGLSHLLSVITDQKAVESRIKDLQAATNKHNESLLASQELQRSLQEKQRILDAQVRDHQSNVIRHNDQVAVDKTNAENYKRDIEASLRDVANRNENLRQREDNLQNKARSLDLAVDQLRNREINVAARETKLLGREQHVDQHAARHAGLVEYLRNNGFINI